MFAGLEGSRAAAEMGLDTDRTAVVVTLEQETLLELEAAPDLGPLQSWFLSDDEPVRVVAVDKGPAEVVVVRDPTAQPYLDALAKGFIDREIAQTVAPLIRTDDPKNAWDPRILKQGEAAFIEAGREIFKTRQRKIQDAELAAARRTLKTHLTFGDNTRLRFVSPMAAPVSRTVEQMNVFNLTPELPVDSGGLLSFVENAPSLRFVHRFSDALTIVGRELHRKTQRRAVVVLLEGSSLDRSQISTAEVRNLLRDLQVPVFVWSFGTGPVVEEWGGYLLSRVPGHLEVDRDQTVLTEAHDELSTTLEAQRIVWLDGIHRVHEIELTTAASGVRLAGATQ